MFRPISDAERIRRRTFLHKNAGLLSGAVAASFTDLTTVGATEPTAQTKANTAASSDPAAIWASRERLPVALIVDDPMPCVNPLYYFRLQVNKESEPPLSKTIPLALLEEFGQLVKAFGARGAFTIVPFPAGLGSIAQGLAGYDNAELKQWLDLARQYLHDGFDIHPEVLTHTLALNLETKKLLDISEHDWMGKQNEATLTKYFVEALQILKSVELPAHGVTQPCYFRGDEDAYAQALLNAEKLVNGRKQTHYFLDVFQSHPGRIPYCRIANADAGEFVVSIPGVFDGLWPANDGETDAEKMADFFLTADGKSGHLAQLATDRRPLVFSTHWQSLYGNGSLAGLHGLRILLERIDRHLKGFEWMKLSEIADVTIKAHQV